jgi:hypothetical protein
MDGGHTRLRDRMLRDAIVEVLRRPFDASGDREVLSVVGAGLLGQVTVEGDRVQIELAVPPKWSPFAGALTSEVQRRVQALPEVTLTEITVIPVQPGEDRDDTGQRTSPASQPG